jgi:hypothetical protein
MTEPTHVDGNALGAVFVDIFGAEMTDRAGCCAACGAVNKLASLLVYRSGPGDVLRCPKCQTVILVVVDSPSGVRINFEALRWMEVASTTPI